MTDFLYWTLRIAPGPTSGKDVVETIDNGVTYQYGAGLHAEGYDNDEEQGHWEAPEVQSAASLSRVLDAVREMEAATTGECAVLPPKSNVYIFRFRTPSFHDVKLAQESASKFDPASLDYSVDGKATITAILQSCVRVLGGSGAFVPLAQTSLPPQVVAHLEGLVECAVFLDPEHADFLVARCIALTDTDRAGGKTIARSLSVPLEVSVYLLWKRYGELPGGSLWGLPNALAESLLYMDSCLCDARLVYCITRPDGSFW